MTEPLLAVRDLRKTYGGIEALAGATLSVEPGELVGVIGPNGAGKTTLFDCISGVRDPDGGSVHLDGTDVTDLPAHAFAHRGLVRTFQQTRELTTLTVMENMLLPAPDHPGERAPDAVLRRSRIDRRERAARERARELLAFFELDAAAEAYASDLSGGQRKLLEFARALMLDPDVLLLDEPFAGINPALTEDIIAYVRRLNDEGTAFVIIEHDVATLVDLVDRLIVMNEGSVLVDGDPQAVVTDQRVVDTYLGEARS